MKRVLLFLFAAALGAAAQQAQSPISVNERPQAPREADLQCAGFLSQTPLSRKNFVAAGLYAPHTTRYAKDDIIFIEGGGLQEGAEVRLVRELKDPNRYEAFKGQYLALKSAGRPYADLGHARIVALRGNVAVAHIDYSCEPVVPGDVAVAFQQRPMPAIPDTAPLDRIPAPSTGATTGRIVLGKDFDTVLGTGQTMYLDLGSDKGLHPGDTVRILRTYKPADMQEIDKLSYKATISEDTQRRQMKIGKRDLDQLPSRTVGEAVVLLANPGSSTAMITVALEAVLVGDTVEVRPATTAMK